MAGLYLHIPFCKQACHYCNFHFSTSLRAKPALVAALLRELELQSDYLGGAEISSVYFGGGTPSLLEIKELEQIFSKIQRLHRLSPRAEITLEANPDDLSAGLLRDLKEYTPINRLSIGIQSFHDADLRWMNRAHNAAHAFNCLDLALATGFDNLTIDLIYGSPTTSDRQWQENLDIAFRFGIPHLSCYCLTVEEGTALGTFVRKGQAAPVDEEQAARQMEYLMEATAVRGYEHYEISNFALPGHYAQHNSSYWRGQPYLGIGPSAHSFNGLSRQSNIANNALYIKSLEESKVPFDLEHLSPSQRYNEYVLTSLRTVWGLAADLLTPSQAEHFKKKVQPFLAAGTVEQVAGVYRLTRSGRLLADRIALELFLDPE
ncbi:MAG: radical SAM family heme chaperone HemW [Saprospiraceae bacterium]